MQLFNTAAGAIDGYNKALGEAIADAFRTLLEQKHLYQSVVLDDGAIRKAFLPRVEVGIQQRLSQGASIAHGPAHSPWILLGDNVAVATPAGSAAIKREGGKLTLCGRSPMEYVQVSPEIPKEVARFYSGAVVAHQSGQTLAGLFLLRALCEQWARKFAAADDYADEAISKYMDSLPEDFKARFPSLRSIYEKLSADIHAATGSDELFVQMLTHINEHFSARKLFKLP